MHPWTSVRQVVRSLYITTFLAIVAIGVVYVIAPLTLEDLTHLVVSGLVDSLNEVWREGTDLVSVARELGLYWGHTFTSGVEGYTSCRPIR